MTGYQHLVREHPEAPAVVKAEVVAWEAYKAYATMRTPARGGYFEGDEKSRSLFRNWQAARAAREAISNPRYKQVSTRGER